MIILLQENEESVGPNLKFGVCLADQFENNKFYTFLEFFKYENEITFLLKTMIILERALTESSQLHESRLLILIGLG